jgi:transposase
MRRECHRGGGRYPAREHRLHRPQAARLRSREIQGRAQIECRIGLLKQARAVATCYDKLAVRYEATVQLALIRQSL